MTALSTLLMVAALTAADDTVLVEFTSQNCTHCRAMQPVLERMAGEGCPVQVIDVDQQPDVARQFRIEGVPTFVVLTRGQETGRVMGATSYEMLVQLYRGTAAPVAAAGAAAGGQDAASLAAAQLPREAGPTPALRKDAAVSPMQSSASQYASSAAATSDNPQAAALAASVRLKVEDATGYGFGTGTIIDVHDQEALVVTCGHLFRESQGKGRITVDLFAPGATQPIEGQLIAYNLDRDIALVSIRPGFALAPAVVAPPGTMVRPQDGAFTVGCDKGAEASVRETQITAVNKYVGKPNFCAAGAPVDGRSGGGLFTSDGLLIGICNAADPADNEGLYAGLASIHWQLDQIGQSEIYQRAAQANAATLADNGAAGSPAMPHSMPPSLPQREIELAAAPARATSPIPVTPAVYQSEAAPPAAAAPAGSDDTEIVFIVRSKSNPQERSEVYVVDGATPDLMSRIAEAARTTGQRRAAQASARANAPAGHSIETAQHQRFGQPAIIRGQSGDY